MSDESIGVAVIGAGMAGRAHANGYRCAPTVFGDELPPVRLVAVADAHEPFAVDTARRYGYERAETRWEAVVEADDIDAVSVVVANHLHREIVEALLDAGKHVLCEKPLAPSVADGRAMVDRAEKSDRVAAVGFTFRRSPAINAVRGQVTEGGLGPAVHFNGHYWCDYGVSPDAPMSWRYRGAPGSGALADIGTHLVDVGEYLCGPVRSVRGTVLETRIPDRPVPLGTAVGHAANVPVSDARAPVENEDIATFTATFADGATGTFSVSRIAFGLANSLGFEVFCADGAVAFDLNRVAEFTIADRTADGPLNGYRQVLLGPAHPYIHRGLPMDFPGVGHGQNDFFVFQARAFLEEIAGLDGLPRCPRLVEGLHNLQILDAVVASAKADGRAVTVPRKVHTMKLGAYTACLHDRSLPEALTILKELGLNGAEINAGGFVPAPHLPIERVLSGPAAREEYLGRFEEAGIALTGLNVNGNPLNPDPEVGPKHAEDLRRAITVAGLLGVRRVVAMSGSPAAHPGGRCPSWVVNPWDSQYLDVLDYQWQEVAIPFWKDIQARARDADVKVCIEMHPHNLVFNPGTMERLATEIDATHVGAEMDPSHLFWQGIDPVAAIERLGDLVYHAAAKDTRVNERNCRVFGVLDDRFQRVPAEQNPLGLGGRNTLTRWPADPSWNFVAVGRGHGPEFWAPFLRALADVDAEMAVNIEHEDAELDQVEGLRQAAENLLAAAAAAGV